ncbi:MAG: cation-translocating P-type ATPase family protein [Isosphaeraceae bacterium]
MSVSLSGVIPLHREYRPEEMRLGIPVPAHDHGHSHGPGQDHHEHDHDPDAERRALVGATGVVGVLLVADLLLGAIGSPWQRPFGVPLALVAAIIGGGRVVYLALAALFEGSIGADIALAIACVAAALLGEYFVAAEVVFIALLGECLEAFSFERARRAIGTLLDVYPRTARVIRGEAEIEVLTDQLTVGDLVVIRPGERISVDGSVVRGRSAVDQAVLTGESMPVDKGEGDAVFTGTVNQFGRLEVRAEKVGAATTLGQVIRLLADAHRHRSPLERTADRYARWFLPAVLVASTIVFVATNASALWRSITSGGLPAVDVLPTLAVLVVACPCALVLATPAAILVATARLARRGVLVKGGAAIEGLARVDTIAFDKTGTLTEGKPELVDCIAFGFHAEDSPTALHPDDVLRLAAAAEQPSEHPLARMLVAEARRRGLDLRAVEDFHAQPGAGILSTFCQPDQVPKQVLVGNLRLVREHGVTVAPEVEKALENLDLAGQTSLVLVCDGRIVGLIGARDRVRSQAHDVIHDLKHLGLKDLAILTGDRVAAALAVGKKVHIKQVEAELTPAGKAEWVDRRRADGRIVAMVGDGINDAPALARADVGLALAGVGADLAAEAGSVVLMGDPLSALPETIRIARQTVRVIKQNILFFAFGLNSVAVVLAGFRVLGPVAAAILHQIGSLLVLLNAIRILGFERWHTFGIVRSVAPVVSACRRCRPSMAIDGLWARRRVVVRVAMAMAFVAYAASGITVIGPDQVGLVRRFGRYHTPLLRPGLHVRMPSPIETVTAVEPDRSRVVRVGLTAPIAASKPIVWGAAHGARRDESALFFTGDENLVELAGVVEYHLTEDGLPALLFTIADIDASVAASAEGVLREETGRSSLEAILVGARRKFESDLGRRLQQRLDASVPGVVVDRVRVVDAHPPREVVPAYRDVSAAVSDAERSLNQALADASQRRWAAQAEAEAIRDAARTRSTRMVARAEGEKFAFLAKANTHVAQPSLTEFRLLWDTMAVTLAGRPKVILDRRAAGRRHLWLADPERWVLPKASAPAVEEPND